MLTLQQFETYLDNSQSFNAVDLISTALRHHGDEKGLQIADALDRMEAGFFELPYARDVIFGPPDGKKSGRAAKKASAEFASALAGYDITPLRALFMKASEILKDRYPAKEANRTLKALGLESLDKGLRP